MQEPLDYALDSSGIARVTINRPKRANSFDPMLADALMAALDRLAAEPKLRVLVLSASGKTFSAGIDLNWMKAGGAASKEENYRDALKLARILHRLCSLPAPSIAAVQGAAIGFGVGLVAACDLAVASDKATFRFSEVQLGIMPSVISPYVVGAMGVRGARRYFITGEAMSAAEAARFGLVHQLCAADAVESAASELVAARLAGKPLAQRGIKSLLELYRKPALDDSLIEETARRLAEIRATPEAQAALAAYLAR
jgi:methylglutaconyl-CoA hydratase